MTADDIALVKGEDLLPPLTHHDCQLLVRAAFLPRHIPPRSEVTQLVGWFNPKTCQPSLVEQISGNNRKTLAWQAQADGSMVTEILAGTLLLSFSCRAVLPTALPVPPPLPTPTGQRTLHVALVGMHNGVWHDGYLAHCDGDGKVLSLLTAPDSARLFVPQTSSTEQGIELAAVALPQPAHYLRLCLRALLAAVCRQQGLKRKFTLALDDTALAAMICVVLLSSLYDFEVVPMRTLTPAWKRLLQNLGVRSGQGMPMLALSSLSKLVPVAAVAQIAQDINSQAAVIPAKVLL